MRRPDFIARQSGNPSGVLGRIIAWIMARETADLNQRAVELLRLQPTDHVLEIGFGHGRTVQRIAAAVPDGRVAGVDVSASMTRVAIRRNRTAIADDRVDLETGDAAALPFEDARFDKALSVHTIYFWNDPGACLREIRRVLRPGAIFVLGFTRKGSPRAQSFPTEVYRFYEDDELRQLLIDARFSFDELVPAGAAWLALARAS
jgi:ubiquinone/menaquinone biosynthesis C-methylase UbiE